MIKISCSTFIIADQLFYLHWGIQNWSGELHYLFIPTKCKGNYANTKLDLLWRPTEGFKLHFYGTVRGYLMRKWLVNKLCHSYWSVFQLISLLCVLELLPEALHQEYHDSISCIVLSRSQISFSKIFEFIKLFIITLDNRIVDDRSQKIINVITSQI